MRKSLKQYNCSDFLCGMTRGVDQLGALAAIAEKVNLHCYFPYKHKLSDTEQYIVDKAAEVLYLEDKYSDGCFFRRDRRLVDDCDLLLVVWDGVKSGGTWYTFQYAIETRKDFLCFPWSVMEGWEEELLIMGE